MTDRIILFQENGRASTRGIRQVSEAEFEAYQRDSDTLDYTCNYEGWLGTDTIASVTRTAYGTALTSTSNTTTQSVQSFTGTGYADIKITTAAGRSKTDRINISPRSADARLYDYGFR